MTNILLLSFMTILVICGLFYYYKYNMSLLEIKCLELKIKEIKPIKNKTTLMLIKDEIDAYKKGQNAYTTLRNISNQINKVEPVLVNVSDQTETETKITDSTKQ